MPEPFSPSAVNCFSGAEQSCRCGKPCVNPLLTSYGRQNFRHPAPMKAKMKNPPCRTRNIKTDEDSISHPAVCLQPPRTYAPLHCRPESKRSGGTKHAVRLDRKSTRLNSSHANISYA